MMKNKIYYWTNGSIGTITLNNVGDNKRYPTTQYQRYGPGPVESIYAIVHINAKGEHLEKRKSDVSGVKLNQLPDVVKEIFNAENRHGIKLLRKSGKLEDFLDEN